ncbi:hypothetical protein HDU67_000876, partial [Dinochytrium kinnereticum]
MPTHPNLHLLHSLFPTPLPSLLQTHPDLLAPIPSRFLGSSSSGGVGGWIDFEEAVWGVLGGWGCEGVGERGVVEGRVGVGEVGGGGEVGGCEGVGEVDGRKEKRVRVGEVGGGDAVEEVDERKEKRVKCIDEDEIGVENVIDGLVALLDGFKHNGQAAIPVKNLKDRDDVSE